MRLLNFLVLIILLTGCENEKTISFNPFEPNIDLKTKTVLKSGFTIKWACDGGYNTYALRRENFELNFFEDCNNPGVIIGETYVFDLTHGENCWVQRDSLQLDIEKFNDQIKSIISIYNGSLLEPVSVLKDRSLKIKVSHKNKGIIDSWISCYPDGNLYLTIQNWNR
jgi:hypothetical protein